MYEIRFHGRGGQGVVTAAELLSIAAFHEGKHAQAFPSFGSERMGAPVAAFCRIDDKEIRSREPIATPDALIIQDSSLTRQPDLLTGLKSTKIVLVNTRLTLDELRAEQLKLKVGKQRILCIPATEIAVELLKRNVPNVIMLAAFCAITEIVQLASLEQAVKEKFPAKIADLNIQAARRAQQLVQTQVAALKSELEVSHV